MRQVNQFKYPVNKQRKELATYVFFASALLYIDSICLYNNNNSAVPKNWKNNLLKQNNYIHE